MAMASPFVSEITIFAFNFAPTGWALCQGQLLPISQNTALFSLLGTTYGGNGQTTFALPNMQDNAANSFGQGPGLSLYSQGEVSGAPNVTLLVTELPVHSHLFNATTNAGTTATASQNQPGLAAGGTKINANNANIYSTNPNLATTALSPLAIGVTGGGLPHNNMQPYLTLNYCIAMQGVFPPRS
jgi:microcystin-dependent protein